MYDRVPPELLRFRQFVCWNYVDIGEGKPTKVPFNPTTGQKASVTDPTTWVDYRTAVSGVVSGHYVGIGFVLTEQDPYSFIDLDGMNKDGSSIDEDMADRQTRIFQAFNSYSERSPSGVGLHIIVKGSIPEGRRKGPIEVYSSQRYMTLTGNVYHDCPINERQELLTLLFEEMGYVNGSHAIVDPQAPETKTDDQILTEGSEQSQNGERFKSLWNGYWQQLGYPSQSEADLAFIDMLAMLTQNREQIRRIFMGSWLGQREKAKKRSKYVDTMITKSFDRLVPAIDFDNFRSEIEHKLNGQKEMGTTEAAPKSREETRTIHTVEGNNKPHESALRDWDDIDVAWDVKPPPGLLGDIAKYIYFQSHRPVPEIAMCAAIGLMSGICGRSYNTPTGAGLNLYTVLVAKTAVGKEAMSTGISKLISSLEFNCPSAKEFLGPSELQSGPAIMKRLEKQPSMLCILGEFGLLMQQMCGKNVPGHMKSVRRVLLDAYAKSGQGSVMRGMAYSDQQKNVGDISAPALSILAESTPSTFYESLDESLIAEGLLSRLLIIEYTGDRVPPNPNLIQFPDNQLSLQLGALAANSYQLQQKGHVLAVPMLPEVEAMERAFNIACDEHINESDHGVTRDLWGRAHLKVLKLASIVAVGISPHHPVIDAHCWNWAQELVVHDVSNVANRFKFNRVGVESVEIAQLKRAKRAIKEFLAYREPMLTYGINYQCLIDHVIPHSYFSRRLIGQSEFTKPINPTDKGTNALKRVLIELVASGVLYQLKDPEKYDDKRYPKYGSIGALYRVVDNPGE